MLTLAERFLQHYSDQRTPIQGLDYFPFNIE